MVQMPGDVPHIYAWNDDLDRHYRFEQDRVRLAHRLNERAPRGNLERHFGRIDVMKLAVIDRYLDIFHHTSGKRTALHGFNYAFFNCGNEVLRDSPADNLICELEFFFAGFDPQVNFRELPVSAGLLLMAVMPLRPAVDRLAVRHPGRRDDHHRFWSVLSGGAGRSGDVAPPCR